MSSAGEGVGDVGEVERAEEDGREAEDESVGEADAALRHGAVGGAGHEAVGAALERLVEGAGAAGDDGDAEDGLNEAEVEGADSAAEGAEEVAGGGGDDDHGGDAELEEDRVVAEEGWGGFGDRFGGCLGRRLRRGLEQGGGSARTLWRLPRF